MERGGDGNCKPAKEVRVEATTETQSGLGSGTDHYVGTYGQPAAYLLRKQTKSATLSVGVTLELSQLA